MTRAARLWRTTVYVNEYMCPETGIAAAVPFPRVFSSCDLTLALLSRAFCFSTALTPPSLFFLSFFLSLHPLGSPSVLGSR